MFRQELAYPRLWVITWGVMIVIVIVGSMMPANDIPVPMAHGVDKIVHAMGYAVLAGMASSVFAGRARLIVLLALLLLGGVIEIAQGALTASRSADLLDFAANSLGVLAGGVAFKRAGPRLLAVLERQFGLARVR